VQESKRYDRQKVEGLKRQDRSGLKSNTSVCVLERALGRPPPDSPLVTASRAFHNLPAPHEFLSLHVERLGAAPRIRIDRRIRLCAFAEPDNPSALVPSRRKSVGIVRYQSHKGTIVPSKNRRIQDSRGEESREVAAEPDADRLGGLRASADALYTRQHDESKHRSNNVPEDEPLRTARGSEENGDVSGLPIEPSRGAVVPRRREVPPEKRGHALGNSGVYDEVGRGWDNRRDRRDFDIGGGAGLDDFEVARNDLGERKCCPGSRASAVLSKRT
jgi:hypothetical protein